MALPPTPNNQQQKPFPINAVRFPIDPNDALTDKASAKARQMKGLKRKQKFTRTLEAPSSTNQKTTNFDYAAYREENEMRANENARQVRAAIALAKARSPLSKIKRDRTVLRASLGASAKKQRILTAMCHRDQEKITNLKRINNQLMVNILREKKASNIIIDKAMNDASLLSAKALDMMSYANKTYREAQAQVIAERNLANARVREERVHHSRASTWLRQNLEDKLDKHTREQDTSMSLMLSK
jgi:hypothetical protein